MGKRHYDVVCGIICDEENQVLVSLRNSQQDQGGLWEFPGGKVELNESFEEALSRELAEEVGIKVLFAEPWLQIHHEYPKYHVSLHVWKVLNYEGEPSSAEQQDLRWVNIQELTSLSFPAANTAIVDALLQEERSS